MAIDAIEARLRSELKKLDKELSPMLENRKRVADALAILSGGEVDQVDVVVLPKDQEVTAKKKPFKYDRRIRATAQHRYPTDVLTKGVLYAASLAQEQEEWFTVHSVGKTLTDAIDPDNNSTYDYWQASANRILKAQMDEGLIERKASPPGFGTPFVYRITNKGHNWIRKNLEDYSYEELKEKETLSTKKQQVKPTQETQSSSSATRWETHPKPAIEQPKPERPSKKKKRNASAKVLNSLREHFSKNATPMTRKALADTLGIHKADIHRATQHLFDTGELRIAGYDRSGGRVPAALFEPVANKLRIHVGEGIIGRSL